MEGKELAQGIRKRVDEFKKICDGIDEETASRAPEGRWSPKEIVSHLLGPEGVGMMPGFKVFLEQDTPRLDIEPGNSYFSPTRAQMSFSQLLAQFDEEYQGIANFISGLSPEQLGRKAHIPAFKESPMGEYLTLEAFVDAVASWHAGFHTDHMREILQGLGALPKS
jgi:hypothetical protein